MRINKALLSNISLFILFPFFFVYHFLIGLKIIPPIFGGLFGVYSLILFIIIFFSNIFNVRFVKLYNLSFNFYFLVISIFLVTVYQYFFFDGNLSEKKYALNETFSTIIMWVSVFFIGKNFKIRNDLLIKILKASLLIFLLMLIVSILKYRSLTGLFQLFNPNIDSKNASYQQVGRSILVTILILISSFKNSLKSISYLLLGLILLISIGSRTDFVSLFLIFIFSIYKYFIERNKIEYKLFLFFSFFIFISLLITFILKSRISELFDLSTSMSWKSRNILSYKAIETISNNPFFGNYFYYVKDGGYAHNILSSWACFGFFIFVIYIFLIFSNFIISLRYYTKLKSKEWKLALLTSIIVLIQGIFAVPIFSVLPALSWGFLANAILMTNEK